MRLNILHVIDQYGWSYYFMDMEKKKYSGHNIIIKKHDEITDLDGIDLVYIHSPDISKAAQSIIPLMAKAKGIKVIGQYSGEVTKKYAHVDLLVGISPQTMAYIEQEYPDTPKMFLQESIDSSFFRYSHRDSNRFNVGFVGRLSAVKRSHLQDALKYPVLKQVDWGTNFFVKGRELDGVKNFLNGIDVKILTSVSECMPRVIMEAMATGLPCLSTDVGGVSMLLPDEWLIKSTNENDIVKEFNEKLDFLKHYPKTRNLIGFYNFLTIEKSFSWGVNMCILDSIFDDVYAGNIQKAVDSSYNHWVLPNEEIFNERKKAYKFNNTEYKKLNKVQQPQPMVIPTKSKDMDQVKVRSFLKQLIAAKIQFCLVKETALEAYYCKQIKKPIIKLQHLKSGDRVAIQEIYNNYWKNFDLSMEQNANLNIHCMRSFSLYDLNINIPFPTKQYFDINFGNVNVYLKENY